VNRLRSKFNAISLTSRQWTGIAVVINLAVGMIIYASGDYVLAYPSLWMAVAVVGIEFFRKEK